MSEKEEAWPKTLVGIYGMESVARFDPSTYQPDGR